MANVTIDLNFLPDTAVIQYGEAFGPSSRDWQGGENARSETIITQKSVADLKVAVAENPEKYVDIEVKAITFPSV